MLRSARHSGIGFFAAFAIALFAGALLPRADDPDYIKFAGDQALNVWSNLGFLIAGIAGLVALARVPMREKWPPAIFFLANIATCFGSAYFHAAPDLGARLAWDRLPMTVAFGAFLGMHINERVRMGLGTKWMLPLAALGIATVLWWLRTGDLRFYAADQALAAGGTLFLLIFFAPLYDGDRWYGWGIAFYALAKICELLDRPIYEAIGIAGHPIKHLLAAATTAMVVVHVARRVRATATASA